MKLTPTDVEITRTGWPLRARWRWRVLAPSRQVGMTVTLLGALLEARRAVRWENRYGCGSEQERTA